MFVHPNIDPVILHIAGPISIRWYGVSYLLGFYGAWLLGKRRLDDVPGMTKEDFADFKEMLTEVMDYIINERGLEVISEKHQKNYNEQNEKIA